MLALYLLYKLHPQTGMEFTNARVIQTTVIHPFPIERMFLIGEGKCKVDEEAKCHLINMAFCTRNNRCHLDQTSYCVPDSKPSCTVSNIIYTSLGLCFFLYSSPSFYNLFFPHSHLSQFLLSCSPFSCLYLHRT